MNRVIKPTGNTDAGTRRRMLAYSFACGAGLAFTMACSILTVGFRELSSFFDAETGMVKAALATIAVLVCGMIATYVLLAKMPRILLWAEGQNPLPRLKLSFDRPSIVTCALIILLFWSPYIILQYPCAMNMDTVNELYQFQTSAPTYYTTLSTWVPESYIDHHPVFDTLLFGAFLSLGDLVGSQNVGLFAYSLCQNALTAFGLALACCYMEKLGVPKLFRLISVVFVALFPCFPMWSSAMVKDPLNAAFFLYFMILFVEAVRTRGTVFEHKGAIAAYIVLGTLCILTKKSSSLVFVVATIALIIYARPYWKQMVIGLVAPCVICFALFPLVVYPLIGGVASGGKQEAFGFAFQQVITAIIDDDDLSADERARARAVLRLRAARDCYDPSIVDPVKDKARRDATTLDYLNFLPAYFSIGARHIPSYTSSIFNVCGTLLAPGRTYTFFTTPTQSKGAIAIFENRDDKDELNLTFAKPKPLEQASAAFDEFWRSTTSKLGPFRIFFDVGFYGGWIPIIALVLCFYGRRADAIALVPIVASVGILVIGPAASTRYVLPLLYTTPLVLALCCHALRARIDGSSELRENENSC